MLPLRARFTVSVTSLLDPVANDVYVGRWKQTEIYPKLSRTIVSALKSTPHGLKTITDPNDPNKTGLLADYGYLIVFGSIHLLCPYIIISTSS
jgi:hypothetical protein